MLLAPTNVSEDRDKEERGERGKSEEEIELKKREASKIDSGFDCRTTYCRLTSTKVMTSSIIMWVGTNFEGSPALGGMEEGVRHIMPKFHHFPSIALYVLRLHVTLWNIPITLAGSWPNRTRSGYPVGYRNVYRFILLKIFSKLGTFLNFTMVKKKTPNYSFDYGKIIIGIAERNSYYLWCHLQRIINKSLKYFLI